MLHCYLQVLLCTEIAVQEDFAPSKYDWLLEGSHKEGLKKFSRLSIARHILRPSHTLVYNLTTTLDPLVGWEGCPSLFIIPMDAFGISIRGTLSASSLVPPLFRSRLCPGWAPGLPPAKSGPGSISTMFNSSAISSGWRCYLCISRS